MSIDMTSMNALLAELRAGRALASGKPITETQTEGDLSFAEALKRQLDKVNTAQEASHELTRAYIMGESGATLQDVMIKSQQADLAFMQLVRSRDKLVSAYNDIMKMSL